MGTGKASARRHLARSVVKVIAVAHMHVLAVTAHVTNYIFMESSVRNLIEYKAEPNYGSSSAGPLHIIVNGMIRYVLALHASFFGLRFIFQMLVARTSKLNLPKVANTYGHF